MYACMFAQSSGMPHKFIIRLAVATLIASLFVIPCNSDLVMSLSTRNTRTDSATKLITFCIDCPSPDQEGSAAYGLLPKHGMSDFQVFGQLVYCVPNYGESKRILNAHQFTNRIVLVDRGKVPILDKIEKIIRSAAVGIIIADDGRCNESFSYCGPRAGSVAEGGFAAYDSEQRWGDLDIPVMIVTVQTADTLRRMMGFKQVEIPKLGFHNITLFNDGSSDEL
mmetsp:Transcript_24567/g.40951  ORF Transcript_24567/g.40951 Transcript_24567/m.40951 type:complete len:223 (-) Transcript_24567:96-764(-)